MRKSVFYIASLFGILSATAKGEQRESGSRRTEPRQFSIVVYHAECTECGDFEIESGEVKVPLAFRERFLQAVANSPRSGPGDYSTRYSRLLAYCNATGWRVGNVKLASEAAFDKLFLLPGRTRTDTIKNKFGVVYPWDFNRRYRVTVEVVGIKWSYLTVRVRKAVRLSDRKE